MDTITNKLYSVSEASTLDGMVQQVDCSGTPAVIWLQSPDGRSHKCLAMKELAVELMSHDRTTPIRMSGHGEWQRNSNGEWQLTQFQAGSWEPLATASILEILDMASKIDGNGWNLLRQPIGEHQRLRDAE